MDITEKKTRDNEASKSYNEDRRRRGDRHRTDTIELQSLQDHFWKKNKKNKVSYHFTIPKWNRNIDSWLSSYLNDSSRTSSA